METFLVAFGVFLLAVCGMAVGVVLNNRKLQGSCGGLANMRDGSGESLCAACGDAPSSCDNGPPEPLPRELPRTDCRGDACENFGTCDGSSRQPVGLSSDHESTT